MVLSFKSVAFGSTDPYCPITGYLCQIQEVNEDNDTEIKDCIYEDEDTLLTFEDDTQ